MAVKYPKAKIRTAYVDILGADELIKELENLGEEAARFLNEAAAEGAKIALAAAAQKVPRSADGSHGQPPGMLAASLHMIEVKRRTAKYSRKFLPMASYMVGPKYSTVHSRATGGPGVNYGHLVELGHKAVNGKQVAAQPFLRPAVDQNKSRIAEAINKKISEIIRKTLR